MKSREIYASIIQIQERRKTTPAVRVGYEAELLALRDLVVGFLDATDKGCPESMKTMSIDQTRLLNQLHLAVGL